MKMKLSILSSEPGVKAVTLHEAVIENINTNCVIAMDSDYIMLHYQPIHCMESRTSAIQIRSTSTFQVLNTIVDAKTYVFHYLNGLIATAGYVPGEPDDWNWIRLKFRLTFFFKMTKHFFRIWEVKTGKPIKKIPCCNKVRSLR